MADLHGILIDLANRATTLSEQKPTLGYNKVGELLRIAIIDAAEQIEAQQRERVEKLSGMLKKFAEVEIPTKGHIYGLENTYDLLCEMRESAKAALKELEATAEKEKP